MALVKVGEKALEAVKVVESTKIKHRPLKRKVLDEDAYITDLEKIIQRDFFPDLEKLHSQVEYMEARDNNDVTKMREIAIKLQASTVRKQQMNTPTPTQFEQAVTPATFETPDISSKSVQTPAAERVGIDGLISNPEPSTTKDTQETSKAKGKTNTDLSLDKYLSNYTSEDNASFGDLMEVASERRREKHAWLYEEEKRLKQESEHLLMLNGPETLAIEGAPAAGLNSWTYKAKNSLMYVPDGVEDSAEEKINRKPKEREILYENTRFLCNPHRNSAQIEAKARAVANRVAMKQGKIGHDGKEILESETPRVKGYGFVTAPSPAPGVHDSPLMTWGEIESTPMRIDGSQTPVTKTLGFKMPKNPRREELARSLVEKNVKQHRAKKEAALKKVTQRFTSPSFGTLNSVERIRTLSPAAQVLVNRRIKGTDKALRESYTPSPRNTPKTDKTPILRATPTRTPVQTPDGTPGGSSGGTPGSFNMASNNSSLTDNLLDLPRRDVRKKATDFF